MEEHYSEATTDSEGNVLKLVVKALSNVVQSGAENIEIAVMKPGAKKVFFFCSVLHLLILAVIL